MLKLSKLTSITKKRKRVGRGGSRGGTSGKGHKGQKARSGPTLGIAFVGGQMPLARRLPKRGFSNARFKKVYQVINLDRLENLFDNGSVVDKMAMYEKGLIKKFEGISVKILAMGEFSKKLIVHADAFSESAIKLISSKGGEAHVIS